MVSLLLKRGADPNALDKFNETPLSRAMGNGAEPYHYDVAMLLLKHTTVFGCAVESSNGEMQTELHRVIAIGYFDHALKLLRRGAPLTAAPGAEPRFMLEAALSGDLSLVKALVQRGVAVTADDRQGRTFLHYAAESRNLSLVKYLLVSGAAVDVADKKGVTPLMVAARTGFVRSLPLLLKHGANIDVFDAKGDTALHYAAFSGNVAGVNTLIEAGADVSVRNKELRTALFHAVNKDCIEVLIVAGCDVNARDKHGPHTDTVLAARASRGSGWLNITRATGGGYIPHDEISR